MIFNNNEQIIEAESLETHFLQQNIPERFILTFLKAMTKPIPGENRFATSPVRSSDWGFMDVTLQLDLEACADFLSAANYPNPLDALEAEWGSTNNCRWLLSTNGYASSASPPVYNNIILGQEAYGEQEALAA